jgi:CDP-paratose 2-epimerase
MRLLITGGAGFVGANLAVALAQRHPGWELVALDNLYRRGSELNLPRLADAGVEFVRGDVREPDDVAAVPPPDAIVECSAEPSALAGLGDDAGYVFHTNLTGAFNCLELARRSAAALIFLSTSRVYPVEPLRSLAYEEAETRFELEPEQPLAGASGSGIAEDFPLMGARTLYGTTKLAAELLIVEYAEAFGLRAVVDRCGVIAGPWQMGRVDQGVFTYWMLEHYFRRPLRYIGFGGSGKQVRDLLHVDDLVELIDEQLGEIDAWAGETVNVGGGRECSLSLVEATEICRRLTGNEVPIEADPETRPGDVPIYISDCRRLFGRTEWRPRRGPEAILADIHAFIEANAATIDAVLGPATGRSSGIG